MNFMCFLFFEDVCWKYKLYLTEIKRFFVCFFIQEFILGMKCFVGEYYIQLCYKEEMCTHKLVFISVPVWYVYTGVVKELPIDNVIHKSLFEIILNKTNKEFF